MIKIDTARSKNKVYFFIAVRYKSGTVYKINCHTATGLGVSVSFSTFCSAYKFFQQFKPKKSKSITKNFQEVLW